MESTEFVTTWDAFSEYKSTHNHNDLFKIWQKILNEMPDEIKSNLPETEPELEIAVDLNPSEIEAIPYFFKIPNICNCNGINKFLEQYTILVRW